MKWRKHKDQKKKPKKFVKLLLERNGETKEITLQTGSIWNLSKKIKPLISSAKQGWIVTEVTGNDAQNVAFISSIAGGHTPGAKEMLSHAGLPSMPKKLKKFFKKE